MINYKHKFIFIHIPKCAGESVSSALKFKGEQKVSDFKYEKLRSTKHETIAECITVDQTHKDYFKFSFVRNPWDRMLSLWAYYKKRRYKPVSDVNFRYFIKNLEEAACGVQNHVYTNSHRKINMLYPQYHFISDWWGNNILDFIGRFENLQEDFDIVCDKIGIPRRKIPHENSTKHKHYSEYYDDETREIVAEKYAKDIEYFEYEFENDT